MAKSTFAMPGNEIEDIISSRPPFIVRWGTVLFAILLTLLLVICWFIRYPDLVEAPAKLTSINSPKQVICLTTGKLIRLKVKENELVKQGAVLGFIESTANHNEILALDTVIAKTQQLLTDNLTEEVSPILNHAHSQLGELQQTYQILTQAYLGFRNYLTDGVYLKKKSMLFRDIDNLKKLHVNLEAQKSLQIQDLNIVQETFEVNEKLKKDKIIADFDLKSEQSRLINKKLTLPLIDASIINNEIQQDDKRKEIDELNNVITQQKDVFQQALNTFKSQLDDWKKKYILIAPVDGTISFASFIQENQQLQSGQTVCFVNPENSEYFAQITIPQDNFGKVAKGQNVILKFNSYPYQEYGYVNGKIDFITHIPTDSGYLAKITFANGLITTYNKQLQYSDGLTAQAQIITKDLRLLERFYYDLKKHIKR
jgi:multidrug efflux pump subunit AcrA (membrane-fusion protein)